jgi:hypothetical protein
MNKGELTEEEVDLIVTGKRPEGMDYELFSYYRKLAKGYLKAKLKGTMFFTSVDYIPQSDKTYKRVTDTYKKKDNA